MGNKNAVTVAQLIAALQGLKTPNAIVRMSSDPEGNTIRLLFAGWRFSRLEDAGHAVAGRSGRRMSALIDKIVMASVGDHLILQTPEPGRCGGCSTCFSFFICRGGRVFCIHCDAAREREAEVNARVTLGLMFSGPVRVRCECPVSKDPSDLFKCVCPAGEPQNKPGNECIHDVPLEECSTCSAGLVEYPVLDHDHTYGWNAPSGTILPRKR